MAIALIVLFVLSALLTVSEVGKPRRSIDAELAAATVFFDALLIAGVVIWLL